MSNIGRQIHDFSCNGFAGRRYDLADSTIEAEGHDWIVIRKKDSQPEFISFEPGWQLETKQSLIDTWCNDNDF